MYSKELADIMKSHLDSHEVEYCFDEKEGVFDFTLGLEGRIKSVRFYVIVSKNSYFISGALDELYFDDAKVSYVSELLHRINCLCHESRFELDADGKTVCCTQCINCKGVTPNNELITYTISDIVFCIKEYGDGLVDVIEGRGTPKEICDKYEKELLS